MDFLTRVKTRAAKRRLGTYAPLQRKCHANFWDEFAGDEGGDVVPGGMRQEPKRKGSGLWRRRQDTNIWGGMTFSANFSDAGNGTVNLVPQIGGVATFTRNTVATTRAWKPCYLPTGEMVTVDFNFMTKSITDVVGGITPTVTRAGATATRVNEQGFIEVMAANTPRWDYDPITKQLRGLLVEGARSNLLTSSNAFNNWNVSCGLSSGAAIGPDGLASAWALTDTSSTAFLSVAQSVAVPNDGNGYSFSIYVKKGDGSAPTFGVNLNLAGGTPVASNPRFNPNNGLGNFIKIEDCGAYWRVAHRITNNTSGNTSITVTLQPAPSTGKTNPSSNDDTVTGTGTNIIFGAQLEANANSDHNTSYIPTAGASQTRAADAVVVAALSPWFNTVEGSVYCEAMTYATSLLVQRVWQIDDTGTNNRFIQQLAASGASDNFSTIVAGVDQGGAGVAIPGANVVFRAASAYKVNDLSISVNGSAVVTDNTASLPVVTNLNFNNSGGLDFFGWLRRWTYSPQRIVNASLQALSNGTPSLVNGSKLVSVGNNVARSWTESNGLYGGYYAEGTRTNINPDSENLLTANWANTRSTRVGDCMVAPDGKVTADKLVEDNSVTTTHMIVGTQPAITPNTSQAISGFFKAGERSWVLLALSDATLTNQFGAYFDLGTGSIGSSEVIGAGVVVTDKRIEPWGNGWYRCTVIGGLGVGGVANAGIRIYTSTGDNGKNYTGDNVSGFFCWGLQQEDNVNFASSYIVTSSGSATRNTDVLTYPFPTGQTQSEGTMYCEIIPLPTQAAGGGNRYTASLDVAATTDDIAFLLNGGTTGSWQIRRAGANEGTFNFAGQLPAATVAKTIFSWKAPGSAGSKNGGAVSTIGAVTLPTLTQLSIGHDGAASQQAFAAIKNVRVWPTQLPQDVLPVMTR